MLPDLDCRMVQACVVEQWGFRMPRVDYLYGPIAACIILH